MIENNAWNMAFLEPVHWAHLSFRCTEKKSLFLPYLLIIVAHLQISFSITILNMDQISKCQNIVHKFLIIFIHHQVVEKRRK